MIRCESKNGNISMNAVGTVEELVSDVGIVIKSIYEHLKEDSGTEAAECFKDGVIYATGNDDSICWLSDDELEKKHNEMLEEVREKISKSDVDYLKKTLNGLKDLIDEIDNGIKEAEENEK